MEATSDMIVLHEQERTLSNELLTKIFLFLNMKQVAQLQCVCKSWRELLNDHYFIRLYYKQCLFLMHYSTLLSTNTAFLTWHNDDGIELDWLPLVTDRTTCIDEYFVGSANGVFCICTRPFSNPSFALCYGFTLTTPEKVVEDYASPSGLKPSSLGYMQSGMGFGYDIQGHDYKIFTMKKFTDNASRDRQWVVKIYSLKHNSWKDVGEHPLSHGFCPVLNLKVEFSRGFFYSLVKMERGREDTLFLMMYDLYKEEFPSLLFLPDEAPEHAALTNLNGELSLYYRSSELADFQVWVLDWEGTKGKSWTKLVSIPHSESKFTNYVPVAFLKECKTVLLLGRSLKFDPVNGCYQSYLLWCHVSGKIVKIMEISEGCLKKLRDQKRVLGEGHQSLEVPKSKPRLLC